MATLKIIEYLPCTHSLNVVVAIMDKTKELGRVTVRISPEWSKREALAEIARASEKFIVTKEEMDTIINLVQEVDGIEVEAFIAR